MVYGQPPLNHSSSIDEEYERYNYLFIYLLFFLCKCHTTFHIRCNNKDFKWAHGKTLDFSSMERLWVGVKKFMHDMFVLTMSTIETPCLGMSIVFNKMWSLHLIMWWNHIDLHFGTKDYCNVIYIILMYKLLSFNKIFLNSILTF